MSKKRKILLILLILFLLGGAAAGAIILSRSQTKKPETKKSPPSKRKKRKKRKKTPENKKPSKPGVCKFTKWKTDKNCYYLPGGNCNSNLENAQKISCTKPDAFTCQRRHQVSAPGTCKEETVVQTVPCTLRKCPCKLKRTSITSHCLLDTVSGTIKVNCTYIQPTTVSGLLYPKSYHLQTFEQQPGNDIYCSSSQLKPQKVPCEIGLRCCRCMTCDTYFCPSSKPECDVNKLGFAETFKGSKYLECQRTCHHNHTPSANPKVKPYCPPCPKPKGTKTKNYASVDRCKICESKMGSKFLQQSYKGKPICHHGFCPKMCSKSSSTPNPTSNASS